MDKYYNRLIKLSHKAAKKGCVPVSAIIVKNNKIISFAYNKRKKTNNVMDHAEIICIKKANKKMKSWNLSMCELYVSMKPCKMCESIINESRIKRVYYILENAQYAQIKESESEKIEYIKGKDYDDTYKNMLSSFFKKIREKK